MIRIVDDIKKAKYITHSGTMHADEVFSTAFLGLYKGDIDLFRTSEVNPNEHQDALVYDIGRGKFDHHQIDRAVRENGIPYCSFGLIWKEFGRDFLKNRGTLNIEEVYEGIDKDLVEGIDAIDNGIFPKVEAQFKIRNLCDVIKLFNPSYGSTEEESAQFLKAVDVATKILEEEILSIVGRVKAKKEIEERIPEAIEKHYLVLDQFMPYEEAINEMDKEKQILYVVFPSNRGGYNARTVNISADDHTSRKEFPQQWAGRGKDLAEITGVAGATFCHLGRFIVSATTKEAVIKLVDLALQNTDNSKKTLQQ